MPIPNHILMNLTHVKSQLEVARNITVSLKRDPDLGYYEASLLDEIQIQYDIDKIDQVIESVS